MFRAPCDDLLLCGWRVKTDTGEFVPEMVKEDMLQSITRVIFIVYGFVTV
jgi:hypothetical protein